MSRLVFKILKPASTFFGLDYNNKKCKKSSATLLNYSNFGILQQGSEMLSIKQMKVYMNLFCSTNTRIRNKQFHAILSCKGSNYSFEELKSVALEITNHLGYNNTPIAVFGHNDTEHNHIHIVTTRINEKGKKVPHHFEGKRANDYLQELLLTDKKQLFNADLNHALSYSFSTINQLTLLMEQKGYESKSDEQALSFYKFGTIQGKLPLAKINQLIKPNITPDKQITTIISSFKRRQGNQVVTDEKAYYPVKQRNFSTSLTDKLYKQFGWEFIFFKNQAHVIPYGYIIIDHNKKTIHKGSDIYPIHHLLSPKPEHIYPDNKEINTNRPLPEISPGMENSGHEELPSKVPISIPTKILDALLEQSCFNAEQEQQKNRNSKKKKGRFI